MKLENFKSDDNVQNEPAAKRGRNPELLALLVLMLLSLFSCFLFSDYLIYFATATLASFNVYVFMRTEIRKWKVAKPLVSGKNGQRLLMNLSLFFANVITISFFVILAFSLAVKFSMVDMVWPENTFTLWFLMFAGLMACSILAIETVSSLFVQNYRQRTLSIILMSASLAITLFSILTYHGVTAPLFKPGNFIALLNVAAIGAMLLIFSHRDFPDVVKVVSQGFERAYRKSHYSKSKNAIWVFTIISAIFAIFLFLLIRLGVLGTFANIGWKYAFFATAVIVLVVVGIAVYGTLRKSNVGAFKSRGNQKYRDTEQRAVGLISLVAAFIFALLAVLMMTGVMKSAWVFDQIDFTVLSLLSAMAPISFYRFLQNRRLRMVEERFADFLHDLAESRRAGMTIARAIRKTACGDYGLLTPYIVQMGNRLSLGLTFIDVLERFAESIKSKLVKRGVALTIESFQSGGNIADSLDSAANDIVEMKYIERERTRNMGIYPIVIYVTFFVFLFTIAVLFKMFLPALHEAASMGMAGLGSGSVVSLDEVRFIYFSSVMVQALGNGMVAGVLSDSKITTGTRHSSIMMFVGWLTFKLFIW